ncbi:hypothetical protein THAOC_25281, partial [Thalassiosira oceanica]
MGVKSFACSWPGRKNRPGRGAKSTTAEISAASGGVQDAVRHTAFELSAAATRARATSLPQRNMASLRNLSGAPDLGSGLGGSAGSSRRRARAMTADGDVTSSSISSSLNFPPVLGMGFSSQLGNNDSHTPRASRRSILNPGGPSSSQAHNIAGGSDKRILAQTWDAMSGRLSPTGRSISMKSFGSLDNHSISGSESSFRASSPRPGRTKSLITMLGSASNSHDASYGNPDSSDDGSEESKHEEGLDATVPEILPPVEESHVKEVKGGNRRGILRENQSDLKDSRVRFDEGNRDLGKRSFSVTSIASTSSRPGFSAKLPALTTWDRGDHDSGILSPTSAASSTSGRNAYAHR